LSFPTKFDLFVIEDVEIARKYATHVVQLRVKFVSDNRKTIMRLGQFKMGKVRDAA